MNTTPTHIHETARRLRKFWLGQRDQSRYATAYINERIAEISEAEENDMARYQLSQLDKLAIQSA